MTEQTVIATPASAPPLPTGASASQTRAKVPGVGRGRPSKYRREFVAMAADYFADPSIAGDAVPTIAGLACYLGISGRTKVYEYMDLDPDFRDVVKSYGQCQTERHLTNRLVQKETFTPGQIFALKNLAGWSDRTDSRFEESAATLLTALAGAVSLPMVKRQGQGRTVEGEQVREQLPEAQADSDYGQNFDLYATDVEKLE